jgi:hypothetical protein
MLDRDLAELYGVSTKRLNERVRRNATHEDLARRLQALERKYDKRFRVVFVAIRELMARAEPPRRRIGF